MNRVSITTVDDILTVVPALVGYQPHDAWVVLGIASGTVVFTACGPIGDDNVDDVNRVLHDHGADSAVIVVYADHDAADHAARIDSYLDVFVTARLGTPNQPLPPMDTTVGLELRFATTHPIYASRDDVAARIAIDPDVLAAVELATPHPYDGPDAIEALLELCASDADLARHARTVRSLVDALHDNAQRDQIMLGLTRSNAAAHVEVLTFAARGTQDVDALPVLTLLVIAGWLAGDPIASAARDRAQHLEGADTYTLLQLARQALMLSPTNWDTVITPPNPE